MAGSVVFAVFAMISFPGIASAQAADPVTIWDGVYTEAQAVRGQELVQKNCSACHTASEWSNTAFIINWSGRPVHELQEFLASSMPLDAPGKLSEEEYVDIVAYMLKLNAAPSGKAELTAANSGLSRIRVTPPRSD